MSVATMLPHSLEAEQSVLGAVLQDRDTIATLGPMLSPDDFYDARHAEIWRAMKSLFRDRTPADLVTVTDRLVRFGMLETAGTMTYLAEVMNAVPTYVHGEYYADIVRKRATQRRLIRSGTRIVSDAYQSDADPMELIANARRELSSVAPESEREHVVTFADLAAEGRAEMARRLDPDYQPDVVPTGIADIDRHLRGGGAERGQKIVIAGRPGSGKTSFGMQWVTNYARWQEAINPDPNWTIVFSAEMTRHGLMWRAISEGTSFGQADLNNALSTSELQSPARLSSQQYALAQKALDNLAGLPVWIDDRSRPTTDQMHDTIERLKAQHPVRCVLFDYIELAGDTGQRNDNAQERLAKVSQGLMQIAKECDVTMLILSQLNRNVEAREDKRPRLSDLRQSGAIEQDADIVFGLYRNDYYAEHGMVPDDPMLRNVGEILFLKHRDGTTPIVKTRFNPKSTSFHSLGGPQ